MERLILLEHTVPYDSLDFVRAASGGGIPGGVCGLGSLLGTYPPAMVNKKSRLIVVAGCGKLWLCHGRDGAMVVKKQKVASPVVAATAVSLRVSFLTRSFLAHPIYCKIWRP
jgi:hypothetical protein